MHVGLLGVDFVVTKIDDRPGPLEPEPLMFTFDDLLDDDDDAGTDLNDHGTADISSDGSKNKRLPTRDKDTRDKDTRDIIY